MINGNAVIMSLVGLGIGGMITAIGFNGTRIDNNRQENTGQHTTITDKMVERDEKLLEGLHRFEVRQEVLIEKVEASL